MVGFDCQVDFSGTCEMKKNDALTNKRKKCNFVNVNLLLFRDLTVFSPVYLID